LRRGRNLYESVERCLNTGSLTDLDRNSLARMLCPERFEGPEPPPTQEIYSTHVSPSIINELIQAGTNLRKFESGAVRADDVPGRFDLACPTALQALAATLAEGLLKYGLDNWSKGMDIGETANHAINHLFLYLAGDKTEPHLAHALTNLTFLIHFDQHCTCHQSRAALLQLSKDYAQKAKG